MSVDKSAKWGGVKPVLEAIKGAPAAFKAHRTAAAMSKMRTAARAQRAAAKAQPAAIPPPGTMPNLAGIAGTNAGPVVGPVAATGFLGKALEKTKNNLPVLFEPGLTTRLLPGKKMLLAGGGYGLYEAGRAHSDWANHANLQNAANMGATLAVERMRTPQGRLSGLLPNALFDQEFAKRYPNLAPSRQLVRQWYNAGNTDGGAAFRKLTEGMDMGRLATLYRHIATPPELPR